MNKTCRKLIAQMVVASVAGDSEKVWSLYDMYYRELRLHAPVWEFVQAKEMEEGVA